MQRSGREPQKGRIGGLFQKIQEIKGKFKPRLGMLNDQQGSTLSDQEKIKGRWKQYTEALDRREKWMTCSFEENSYEEELIILESEVKAALKVLGRNKSSEQIGYQ